MLAEELLEQYMRRRPMRVFPYLVLHVPKDDYVSSFAVMHYGDSSLDRLAVSAANPNITLFGYTDIGVRCTHPNYRVVHFGNL